VYHRRQLEHIRAKAGTLRQKLQATPESGRDKATNAFGGNSKSLLQGFDRWANRDDKEFPSKP